MSIFRKGRETPSAPQPSNFSPSPRPQQQTRREPAAAGSTYIAQGTKVIGEVTGDAELVVDGVVEGEIRLDSRLIIGSGGTVKGTIYAVSVQVGGKVFGNIHGKESVEVLASGRLEGDISAPSVPIAKGAFFQGSVAMSSPGAKPSQGAKKKPGAGDANTPIGKSTVKKNSSSSPSASTAEESSPGNAKSNNPGQAGGKK